MPVTLGSPPVMIPVPPGSASDGSVVCAPVYSARPVASRASSEGGEWATYQFRSDWCMPSTDISSTCLTPPAWLPPAWPGRAVAADDTAVPARAVPARAVAAQAVIAPKRRNDLGLGSFCRMVFLPGRSRSPAPRRHGYGGKLNAGDRGLNRG